MSDGLKSIALVAVCALALIWIASRLAGESPSALSIPVANGAQPLPPETVTALSRPSAADTAASDLRSSRQPPPPDALAGNAELQAAYDASAKPGEFVTPPQVSVPH